MFYSLRVCFLTVMDMWPPLWQLKVYYSEKVLESLGGWGLRAAILEEGLGSYSLPALYLDGCFYGGLVL